jgi:hypothetical protein
MSWKRVDFPLEGNPINAARSMSAPSLAREFGAGRQERGLRDSVWQTGSTPARCQGVGSSASRAATGCGEDLKKRKLSELKRTKVFGISRLQLTLVFAFFTIQWSSVGLNGR